MHRPHKSGGHLTLVRFSHDAQLQIQDRFEDNLRVSFCFTLQTILGIKQVDLVACLTCLVTWLFKQVKQALKNFFFKSSAGLDLLDLLDLLNLVIKPSQANQAGKDNRAVNDEADFEQMSHLS
jgi:hypothetical protein